MSLIGLSIETCLLWKKRYPPSARRSNKSRINPLHAQSPLFNVAV
jgi:hypothetical protein